jgi:hypothetical protein
MTWFIDAPEKEGFYWVKLKELWPITIMEYKLPVEDATYGRWHCSRLGNISIYHEEAIECHWDKPVIKPIDPGNCRW